MKKWITIDILYLDTWLARMRHAAAPPAVPAPARPGRRLAAAAAPGRGGGRGRGQRQLPALHGDTGGLQHLQPQPVLHPAPGGRLQ